MASRASLDAAFAGAHGVYSVQNTYTSGVEAEVQHGKNVADAARAADVQHVVYGSAGPERQVPALARESPSFRSRRTCARSDSR